MLVQPLLARFEELREKKRAAGKCTLAVQGTEVTAISPEGKTASMPIEAFLAKVAPPRIDTGDVLLPDGIKAVITEGAVTIWVYECPPSVRRFLWISQDSPEPFGPGTKYRTVRLALPYLIIIVVFALVPGGGLQLTATNECFFRVAPLKTLDDALLYPALLNCSRFEPQDDSRPLSWICTQHLRPTAAMRNPDLSKRMTASFEALRHCLLETGFNLSSEHHEGSSWFTESQSRKLDPRICTVEAWEAASAQNPLFVLEVPWIPARHTVRQISERIFKQQNAQPKVSSWTASALARIVFNQK